MSVSATAFGVATIDSVGGILDCWFPTPRLGEGLPSEQRVPDSNGDEIDALSDVYAGAIGYDPIRNVRRVGITVSIEDLDGAIFGSADAFLRLHLLSHRLVAPNTINLDGLLTTLRQDVAWTSAGPCCHAELPRIMARARAAGIPLHVRSIFPVPPMLDYVWPEGVIIADGLRVLLGAYLSPGTTLTPEGACGFNAGTLGRCMVEGRISIGVVVGAETDVGGGASLMGVTSGGGRQIVSIGKRCLLGANSGVGIALGDDCVVEAGCYVTAGTLVRCPDGQVVKAWQLAGRPDLLFRRHSQSGALEAVGNNSRWNGLNAAFHHAA
ncbi:DapH/DapD/GlmU-related protein [Sphingomonas sp.]|uniref:DapH/DapD/GlmU-related protein n=1 Tax=Sphingomonas sp. TaxID=28214 RepID=UPI003B3AACBA